MCGRCFEFDQHNNYLVGRESDCHIPIPDDKYASKHHSVLRVKPTHISIRDLGSRNGTCVNEVKYGGRNNGEVLVESLKRKAPEVILNDGDQVKIGHTVFQVSIWMPVFCDKCGDEITGLDSDKFTDINSTLICSRCRQQTAEPVKSPPQPQAKHCQKCGKDVPQETDLAEEKDYICRPCRIKMEASSTRFMRQVLKGITVHRPGSSMPNISAYDIESELGVCGYGAVYLARRVNDNAYVAVKVMKAEMADHKKTRKKIRQESFRHRYLQRSDTLEFVDRGAEGITFFFIMELCAAESVDKLMMKATAISNVSD
jgi:serine/threonine-protein kinase